MMDNVIILDAGHGHNTPGKRIPSAAYVLEKWRGYREWDLNSRVCEKVKELLEPYNAVVIRSDDISGVTDVPLSKRKEVANYHKADAFISVHHNAGLNGRAGGGVVVYSRCQAANERDFYLGRMASSLYNRVVAANCNYGNRSTPIVQKNFSVLYGNSARIALLLENGFMDGPDDIPMIVTDEYAYKTAQGIVRFLVDALSLHYVGVSTPPPTAPPEPDSDVTFEYVVEKGDSLWSIAAKYLGKGARYTIIKEINNLKTDTIYPGQKLKLPD